MGNRHHDPALGTPVELRERDACHVDGLVEETSLLETVLPGRRVHDEQRLVRSAFEPRGDDAADLRKLLHQVRLRVQSAGGVDDDDVTTTCLARLDSVEGDRCGIRATRRSDEIGSGAIRPDLQLLVGGGPEGVRCGNDDRASMLPQPVSEFADRRRLPGSIHTHDEDDARDRGNREPTVAVWRNELRDHLLEHVEKLGFAPGLPLLQATDDLDGRRDADVGLDQCFLDALPRSFVGGIEEEILG